MRTITFEKNVVPHAAGSCQVSFGNTKVLCVASVDESVPSWRKGKGSGWVTAEYSMLPGSTQSRTRRERNGAKGRTLEIERLIARSLRAVIDLDGLGGEVTITVDCDVLCADGGTRTASISGAYVALCEAVRFLQLAGKIGKSAITGQVAAISVGIVDGSLVADLDYVADSRAEVDMNVVMDGKGRFVEVQGTGERITFERSQLDEMLDIATSEIQQIMVLQNLVLEE